MTVSISLHNLHYHAGDNSLTLQAHIHLGPGHYGLTGANGSGKTTLLQMMAGLLPPVSGRVATAGRLLYLPQHPVMPIADQLRLRPASEPLHSLPSMPEDTSQPDWLLAARLQPMLQQVLPGLLPAEPGMETLLQWLDDHEARLSGGERQKLYLCLCFALQPDILLLDEPGNDLDAAGQRWLRQQLRYFEGVLIIVSHQPTLLNAMNQTLWFQNGELHIHGGNYADFLQWQERHQQAAFRELEHNKKALLRLQQQQQDNQEKAQRRAKSGKRDRRSNSQSKVLLDFKANQADKSRGAQMRQLQRLQEQATQQLSNSQETCQNWQSSPIRWPELKPVLLPGVLIQATALVLPFGSNHPIFLQVHQHEHWRITGANGSGKSTLLRVLSGALSCVRGELECRGEMVRLEQRMLQPEAGVSALNWLQERCPQASRTELRHWLSRAGISSAQHDQLLSGMSGGERMKIALLSVWCNQPGTLLLLDEPDNHLDHPARAALQQALRDWPGAWLLVSHNDDFAAGCGGHLTLQLPGQPA